MKKLIILLFICTFSHVYLFGQATGGSNSKDVFGDNFKYTTSPILIDDNQIPNKKYVDDLSSPGTVKDECDAATTTNITLSGNQSIDDFSAVALSRILVKNQIDPADNGVYVVGVPWTRATDMNTWSEIYRSSVFILNGTENSGTTWTSNMILNGTLESDDILWNKTGQIVTQNLDPYALDSIRYKRGKVIHYSDIKTDSTINLYTEGSLTESVFGLNFTGTGKLLNGDLVLNITSGREIPSTLNIDKGISGFDNIVNSLAVSGTTTKTITLTKLNGTTVSNTFTDLVGDADSDPVNEIQNLGYTQSTRVLTIDGTGSVDVTLPLVTSSLPGLAGAADKTKLDALPVAGGNWTGTLDGREGVTYLNYDSLTNKPTIPVISDAIYGVGWNGNTTEGASKNSLYDIISTISASGGNNISMGWDNPTNTVSVLDAGGTKSAVITGFLESEVDGLTNNEGLLTVAGTVNNITLSSNTSGSNAPIFIGSNHITVTRSGNSIYTTDSGLEPAISKGTGFAKYNNGTGVWSWDGNSYSLSTHAHSDYASLTGAVFSGRIVTVPSNSSFSSMRIPSGTPPSSSSQGDMYSDANGLYIYLSSLGTYVNLRDVAGSYVLPAATDYSLGGNRISLTEGGLFMAGELLLQKDYVNTTRVPTLTDWIGYWDVADNAQGKMQLSTLLSLSGGSSMIYPSVGIPYSTGSAWGSSMTAAGTAPLTLTLTANALTGSVSVATPSAAGTMSATDKTKLDSYNPQTPQTLSGTSVSFNVNNGSDGNITLTGNTTITFQNLAAGDKGNIYVLGGSSAWTLTIAGATYIEIPLSSWVSGDQVAVSGINKKDLLTYWYTGTILVIGLAKDLQ